MGFKVLLRVLGLLCGCLLSLMCLHISRSEQIVNVWVGGNYMLKYVWLLLVAQFSSRKRVQFLCHIHTLCTLNELSENVSTSQFQNIYHLFQL